VRTVDRRPGRAGLDMVRKHDETVREREGRLLSERRDHVLVVREDHNLLPRRGPAVDAVQAGDRIETTQGLLEQHAHAFSPTTRAVFPKYPASSHIPSYAKPIPGWSRLPRSAMTSSPTGFEHHQGNGQSAASWKEMLSSLSFVHTSRSRWTRLPGIGSSSLTRPS